ncbi:MAG: type I-E CRISPR-associated endoribonuclease Cas2e [Acidobacteriota bacterium]
MTMTVVVTVNAPGRFRGFLASCMCEIAPGVYTAPRMTKDVRERLWAVLESWWVERSEATLVMTWPDRSIPGGQQVRSLGVPPRELRDHHGVYLARRELNPAQKEALARLAGSAEEAEAAERVTGSLTTQSIVPSEGSASHDASSGESSMGGATASGGSSGDSSA